MILNLKIIFFNFKIFIMVLKEAVKVVVAFGEAVGKAFSRAVKDEYNGNFLNYYFY